MTVERYGLSLWGDENVLKWAVVMISQLKKKLGYYRLCWVFVAACRLCLVAVRRGCSLAVVCGLLTRWLLLMELGLVGFGRCGSRALGRGLSSCGTRAQLSCSRWKPPKPGIKPMSPELAGGLPITGPPGKSHKF